MGNNGNILVGCMRECISIMRKALAVVVLH